MLGKTTFNAEMGGAEHLADSLCLKLNQYGHNALVVRIPFAWHPAEKIVEHMLAARLMRLPYVERVIGTIRRECLDHVIVLNEATLYRHVKSFLAYYHESRPHLSLAKDAPEPRPVQPPALGAVVAIPQVGGLHHRYERRAA